MTALRRLRRRGSDSADPEPAYLCFAAQDWWYHNQAHSDFQLLRQIARTRRVLVVNSIGMRMPTPGRTTQPWRRVARKLRSVARLVRAPLPDTPDFHVMSPLAVPVFGRPWVERANAASIALQVRLAMAFLGIRRPVAVVTLPTAEPVLDRLRLSTVVANRSDKHSMFAEADGSVIAGFEARLLRRADRVIYSSHALMDDEASSSAGKAVFVDHGVDAEHFVRRPPQDEPADLRAIPHPRVGFFGAVDDLVDVGLLEELAAQRPDVHLVVVGSVTVPVGSLTSSPNVHLLGFRPYSEIPAYGSGLDVALMPWKTNEWIRLCNPIKLKEYLALGLPVVSTPFPELEHYRDVVRVASGPTAFVAAVGDALSDPGGEPARADRRARVAGITWARQAELLRQLCETPPA